MKKLFLCFMVCFSISAYADVRDGCELKFSDGTVLRNIDNASWYLDDGSVFIKETDGDYADAKKPLAKLTKINGESVNLDIPDASKAGSVLFKCDKWTNGEYFAFDCHYGYDKVGTQIGTDDYGTPVYDKCGIPDGGCKLEFSDGTVLENIDHARWYLNNGAVFIKETDGGYAADKPLADVVKVNGESVNLDIPDAGEAFEVLFKCDKWDNNEYFAFNCQYGYDKVGTQIGTEYGTPMYDKCGSCTLEFSDGTVLENIDHAYWSLITNTTSIYKTDGTHAEEKPLADVVKVNGESVNLDIPDADDEAYDGVLLKCNKLTNGEYFAFFCYNHKGTQIGTYGGVPLYDKCIETSGDDEFDEDDDYDTDNDAEVETAKQTLSAFFKYADKDSNKSVWKDAEGNFNTTRLVSDLTAGVVLGTVGGVVSGVVIKKKQLQKGFDVLHCTVGGQTVADWGDTFNVGLQK